MSSSRDEQLQPQTQGVTIPGTRQPSPALASALTCALLPGPFRGSCSSAFRLPREALPYIPKGTSSVPHSLSPPSIAPFVDFTNIWNWFLGGVFTFYYLLPALH